ncbi:type II toxin-antitoxin system RelE/ParE family toxin [Rhizobium sp. LjRoot30]|uniref:type II toxin-antitoxin system RelE/ParE family toxin n=1 Tax=Rhizobium sp. LjRoot30 TaxID=3342320 RepID=UPI003ECEF747
MLDYLVLRAGEHVARAYVDNLIDYCAGFAIFPQRGKAHPRRRGLRTVGYRRKATIAFRIQEDVVTIVRIFHHGLDIKL